MTIPPTAHASFDQFQARSLAEGFDEVLVREWAPGQEGEPVYGLFGTAQVPCRDGVQGAVRS